MPLNDFVCQFCGHQDHQPASMVAHLCPKKGGELVDLINLDDPESVPVDLACDGCGVLRYGVDSYAYSDKAARDAATADGWVSHRKTGDWCPRCAAERKASV
jgi:hypothetical protein